MAWNPFSSEKTIDDLAGQVIRLEIFLKDADLYTFRASGRTDSPGTD